VDTLLPLVLLLELRATLLLLLDHPLQWTLLTTLAHNLMLHLLDLLLPLTLPVEKLVVNLQPITLEGHK
jgi:hypothetical protein